MLKKSFNLRINHILSGYIMLILILLVSACGKKQDKLSDSLSEDILILYDTNPLLQKIARDNCSDDCELLMSFAMKLRQVSEGLMTQSGGLTEQGKFIDPYRKGEVIRQVFEANDLYSSADKLVTSLEQNSNVASHIKNLKETIQYLFLQKEGLITRDRTSELPVSYLCLKVLALENMIYTQLIDGQRALSSSSQ